MIPRGHILDWRSEAPWPREAQIEQDLVISRAIVEIFSHPLLREALAFRGGTALYKLHLRPAARYSEDIDLVQTRAEAAGAMMDALRDTLTPWLGKPQWKQTEGRVTFRFRFTSESTPPIPLKLKVEINTREHFSVYDLQRLPFAVSSRWFSGSCDVCSYQLDEMLGTKLRALYQRKQGRDLFDLAVALNSPKVSPDRVVASFTEYMKREGRKVSRSLFEQNLASKMADPEFTADIGSLLADGYSWDIHAAGPIVASRLIELLPGGPWKGPEEPQ